MNTNLQVRDVVTCTENEIEEKEEEGSRAPQRFLKTSRDRAVRPESFVNGIGGGALREMEQTGEMPVNIATGEISEQTTWDVVTTVSAISRYKQSASKKYIKHLVKTVAKILSDRAISSVQNYTLTAHSIANPPTSHPNRWLPQKSDLVDWTNGLLVNGEIVVKIY